MSTQDTTERRPERPVQPSDETAWLSTLGTAISASISTDDLLRFITQGLALGREARVLALVAREASSVPWKSVFGRIDLVRPGDPPSVAIRPHGNVQVIDERLNSEALLARLTSALGGGEFTVGNVSLTDHGMNSRWSTYRHHNNGLDYGTIWPCVVLSPADCVKNRPFIDGAIEADGPTKVFMGLDHLGRALSGFRYEQIHPGDMRPRRFQIIAWDYRGCVHRLRWKGKKLFISVSPAHDPGLRLVAAAHGARTHDSLAKDAPGDEQLVLSEPIVLAKVTLRRGDDVLVEHSIDYVLDANLARTPGHAPVSGEFGAELSDDEVGADREDAGSKDSRASARPRRRSTTELLTAFLRCLYQVDRDDPGKSWSAHSIGEDIREPDFERIDKAVFALRDRGLIELGQWERQGGHFVSITVEGALLVEESLATDASQGPPAPAGPQEGEVEMTNHGASQMIFISHASDDAELAKSLISLVEAGIEVPTRAIRCTSVDGYKLDGGDDAPEVLRKNLKECAVVLGLLTERSVSSSYVLMELGAAWGFKKRAIPLIGPGVTFRDLPGPFKDIHALKMAHEPDMAGLIQTIAKETGLPQTNNLPKIQAALKILANVLAVAPGVSPRPPLAPEAPPAEAMAPVELLLVRRDLEITQERHLYKMEVRLKNLTKERLNDWYLEVEAPMPLFFPIPHTSTHAAFVEERDGRAFFRVGTVNTARWNPILSGDTVTFSLDYRMDRETWEKQANAFGPDSMTEWVVSARAFVDGKLVAMARPEKAQNF